MAGTSGTSTKTARATKARSTRAATRQPPAGKRDTGNAGRDRPELAGGNQAIDLQAVGARVISVFGLFDSRVLIEMSTETAAMMFPDGALGAAGPRRAIDAVERDLEVLRRKDPALADSALAATALAMAYELEHPFNSATAKSACARALQEALRELRALAPPEEKKDGIDEIAEQRAKRRAGVAKTAHPSRP